MLLIGQNKFNILKNEPRLNKANFTALDNYQNNSEIRTDNKTQHIIFNNFLSSDKQTTKIEDFNIPDIGKGCLYKLSNKHRVLLLPKPGPTTICTTVNCGASNDPKGKEGLSHLLEHLLSKGSKKNLFNNCTNATTNENSTKFYIKSAINKQKELEELLKAQANNILYPDFSGFDLKSEKNIVNHEISMFKKQNTLIKSNNYINKLLFNDSKNINTLGSVDSLNSLSRIDLIRHYNTLYKPENMTTVIVGDVDLDKTINIVNKYFNKQNIIFNFNNKSTKNYNNTLLEAKRLDLKSPLINQSLIEIGFALSSKLEDKEKNFRTAKLAAEIIKAKLNKNENNKFEVLTGYINGDNKNPLTLKIRTKIPPQETEQTLKSIYKKVDGLLKDKINNNTVTDIKRNMIQNTSLINENSFLLATVLSDSLIGNKNIDSYINYKKTIESINKENIQSFINTNLNLNKAAIVVTHPEKYSDSKKTEYSKVSFKGTLNEIDINKIEQYKLKNNLNLIVDPVIGTSRTTIDLAIQPIKNIKTKPGVPFILNTMLNHSIKNSESIKSFYDSNGLLIDESNDKQSITFKVNCYKENTLSSINALKKILQNPELREKDFLDTKEKIKKLLPKSLDNPLVKAKETIEEFPFIDETKSFIENLEKIKFNDVLSFYNELVSNSEAKSVLTIPQKYYLNNKSTLLNTLSTGLPSFQEDKEKSYFNKYNNSNEESAKIYAKSSKDGLLKVCQLYKVNETGNIKDHVAISLLNKLIGNSENSLLYKDLREKDQLTYFVNSIYENKFDKNMNDIGTLNIQVLTTSNNKKGINTLKKSIETVSGDIQKFKNQAPSLQELEIAKKELKNDIISKMETSESRNELLKKSIKNPYYKFNYPNEMLKNIELITPKNIQAAAIIFFKKPTTIAIEAPKDTLDNNKEFLSTIGQLTLSP